ncbi:uncharacterized protein LOC130657622 [Hydractinia symbiolongicarpus]|uniref:uncharacterized protein LOC130657622 n=1 Tax=Hydractinia symbiolongicarpus TaxID=13093 RepID=UPI00254AB1F5|nr:uncharacterized protein LOC130657622 [Hydractinia symbiolongicarpus]
MFRMLDIQVNQNGRFYQVTIRRTYPAKLRITNAFLVVALCWFQIPFILLMLFIILILLLLTQYVVEERLLCVNNLGIQYTSCNLFGTSRQEWISSENIVEVIINEVMKQQYFKYIIQVIYMNGGRMKIKALFKHIEPSFNMLVEIQRTCQMLLTDERDICTKNNRNNEVKFVKQTRYNLRMRKR